MRWIAPAALAAALAWGGVGAALAQAPASGLVTDVLAEADGTRTLRQSIVVAAPADAVWTALTTGEGWRTWAAPYAQVDFRLGGIIETSYAPDPQPGSRANIRNEILAYVPQRMLAIRNVQAPPNTPFDAVTFQSLHTVVWIEPTGARATRVTFAQPGYRDGAAYEGVLKHFRWGNGWTLEKLQERFDKGPVDWARLAAEARARAAAKKD